ncbi:glycoside hydrolase family 18 [Bacteroides caecicola]|uniref:glycoside hydrolase family 18 n=1 Tax=Bacteroides caecicola TaxID=1462569 RepID=UPI002012089D|nr:glycoside hydrolase family 18 [Bacteroides caecicola]MCL1626056.1 glycoside hydrolase family 18 [Bacteroides caecicola]
MKKIYLLYGLFLSVITSLFISCSDWTDAEREVFPEEMTSEEYYAALRAYKQTDHQIAFGWFGNWTGEGAFMKNSLAGIPDSVDIVSIWGNWGNITEAQKKDLEFCQKTKGTRFTLCFIITSVGTQITPQEVYDTWEEKGYSSEQEAVNDFWEWPEDETDEAAVEASIRKYASAIADTITKYGYDGFDIDYEPNYGNNGNIVDDDDRMFIFVDELGKYFGPKSGTGKLLLIDGEPQSITSRPEIGHYFDYFVIQAYNASGDSNLDRRLIDGGVAGPGLIQTYGEELGEERVTNMTIMTENFEAVDAAMNGGYNYTDRYGNTMKSLEGMARWQPSNGFRKGGVGTYHMEAEYGTTPEYKNLRNAIQIMNSSSHSLVKY